MIANAEMIFLQIVAMLSLVIVALRLNGILSDELLHELKKPFSPSTLKVVAVLTVISGQLYWFASRF